MPLLALLATSGPLADEQLEHIIITATQQPRSSLDLPMNWAVIGTEDLKTVQHIHVNEVFQRVPGTWISRGNGQESLIALRSPVLTGAGS